MPAPIFSYSFSLIFFAMKFDYKYGGSSSIQNTAGQTQMSFAPDTLRQPTFFVGKLHRKIAFREAISALNAVVVSDLRFKPKDKTDYKAWAKSQEEVWLAQYIAEKVGDVQALEAEVNTLSQTLRELENREAKLLQPFNQAKRKYFDYLYEKDRDAWFVLDPVITVHPDEVFFECFSQDESTYGKLSCNYEVFKEINEFACGTTNIDYSASLYNEFQKIRNYKETDFKIDPSGFEIQTGEDDLYKEVKIDLPDTWVRGFLQVSSAMTLPATTFELHPMDIYTLCSYLRRFKEQHGPRSLRFVLEVGQPIRVVLEPWNKVLVFRRSLFTGHEDKEIRIWGRRRLLTLERLVPIAKRFIVTLLGSGLPSFFEADMGDMYYTLGLSGWTANDWSRAGQFDLLAPRSSVDKETQKRVFEALRKQWSANPSQLARELNLANEVVHASLTAYTQAGRVIFDRRLGVYRARELSRDPLDAEALRFNSPQEEKAAKIVQASGVEIQRIEARSDGGVGVYGLVQDGNKQHQTSLQLDGDDRLIQASCDCSFFKMNELRQGPCPHILALRLALSRQLGFGGA